MAARLRARAEELDTTAIERVKGKGWRGANKPAKACEMAKSLWGGFWGPEFSSADGTGQPLVLGAGQKLVVGGGQKLVVGPGQPFVVGAGQKLVVGQGQKLEVGTGQPFVEAAKHVAAFSTRY